jgi:hypothetical protein
MSDISGTTPAGAAGGTPSESDLPAMQGLDESTDDPSDPTAARQNSDSDQAETPDLAELAATDDEGPSDPMPDMSGTGGV